jgi:alkanesulfonate monooxygenase SsuD/methylene tetrahydromethanopterin reductase-like flavin-dependent oxidoreductase (luciferase family)
MSRRALAFTPMETNWRLIVEAAIQAEDAGYEAVLVPEGWGLDATVVLGEIARHTRRIRLATGILSIWGRTAATLAMTAATLDDISDGRFILGIGSSTPTLGEGFHGLPFTRPAARLSATLRDVRLLLDGNRVMGVDGQPGLRLGLDPRPHLPIWVAALGPRAVETAIRSADGWFPALAPRSQLPRWRTAAVGAVPSACRLVSGPLAFPATDVDDGREAARQLVGWYLTGMGRVYGDIVAASGFADEVAALRAANEKPRPGSITWPAAAEPLLPELAVHGDAAELGRQLAAWDLVGDLVTVTTGPVCAADLHRLIAACAPAPLRAEQRIVS